MVDAVGNDSHDDGGSHTRVKIDGSTPSIVTRTEGGRQRPCPSACLTEPSSVSSVAALPAHPGKFGARGRGSERRVHREVSEHGVVWSGLDPRMPSRVPPLGGP